MKALLKLIAAAALSLALYLVINGFVLDRPVSLGSIAPMIAKKVAYGEKAPGPKLVIIAGSNARTSHRCALLEQRLGMACVNAGNTAGLGMDYMLRSFEPIIKPGDVVYLPMEYQQYGATRTQTLTGPDAAVLFRHDKAALLARGPEGVIRAAFMFDLSTIIDSGVEAILNVAGVSARFDAKAFDIQGDELGLTHERGKTFDAFIASTRWRPPTAAQFRADTGAKDVIRDFVKRSRARGVRVIAGLPVSFRDVPIPADLLAEMRRFYESAGAEFLVLPNESQYPRDDFYDTPFHLEEGATLQHTELLAQALAGPLKPERDAAARNRIGSRP
jgi:hypothetical protein